MQLPLSNEEANVLTNGLAIAIGETQAAKEHLTTCVSVETPEMLLEVAADYDNDLTHLQAVRNRLKEIRKRDE
jgi:hypothetical protein